MYTVYKLSLSTSIQFKKFTQFTDRIWTISALFDLLYGFRMK